MDFSLTWQQQTVVEELEKFLKKEVAPYVEEYDKKKILRDPSKLKEIFRQLQPFGAISGLIPEEYGGMGLDYTSTGLIFQKMAETWGSLAGTCLIQVAGARLLAESQDKGLIEKYLPEVCAGNLIHCLCITEPNVGSNPADITTTMKKEGTGYRVNGQKTWISNGSVSDLAYVVATVDRSLGRKGVGIILVDRRESPYRTRELEKLGMRAFPTSEVSFEEVFVPEENLIVPPGGGMRNLGRTFELARSLMSVTSVGLARAALATAVSYAKEREQWGKKIGAHQLVQEMIYNMKSRTEASYLLVMRALWMMDSGIKCEAESSLAKAYSTEAAVLTTRECIQIMGAYGYSEEYPAERLYRDATMWTIPDGTTQIQQLIVARDLLGLAAFA
jgi:alkylation response protein AidB-like acyl-CoA dehydrogenase